MEEQHLQNLFLARKGSVPRRMAVEWIPGDSLIEIVGSAKVVNSAALVADK